MAENRGAIRVVIEAVDRVTAPVRRLGAGVRSMLRGLELDKVKEQIGRVTRGLVDVTKAAAAMATKVVAAGTAAAGALAAITRSVAETTAAQTRAARAAGVTLQSYQQLGHAASLVGSSSDEMGAALGSLQDKALEAARGNWELRRAFRLMGVQIQDARGQMRPTADIMGDVAEAFSRIPDSARRTEAAVRLFGEAGIGLIPVLSQGRAGLRAAAEDARKLGLVLSETERQSLSDFSGGMRRVTSAVTGVQNAIAVRLAPILTPLINQFADWIAANRELIALRVEEYIRAIPEVIEKLRTEAERLWEKLQPVVRVFGEWIDWIGPLHAGLAGLFLLLGGGGLIASIISLTSAIAGLGMALLANPIGLAAVAIAGAAYLIYRNWDEIVDFFQGIWDGIKAVWNSEQVQWLRDLLGPAFAAAAEVMIAPWRNLPQTLEAIWGAVTRVFEAGWEKIRPIVELVRSATTFLESTGAGSDPQRQQQQRSNENNRGQNSGPGGETAAEIERRLYGGNLGAPPSAPPVPRVTQPAQRVDAGGRIEITVNQDGQVTRVEGQPNDRRIRYEPTGTGLFMGAPG